jgi:hypothetical protein
MTEKTTLPSGQSHKQIIIKIMIYKQIQNLWPDFMLSHFIIKLNKKIYYEMKKLIFFTAVVLRFSAVPRQIDGQFRRDRIFREVLFYDNNMLNPAIRV